MLNQNSSWISHCQSGPVSLSASAKKCLVSHAEIIFLIFVLHFREKYMFFNLGYEYTEPSLQLWDGRDLMPVMRKELSSRVLNNLTWNLHPHSWVGVPFKPRLEPVLLIKVLVSSSTLGPCLLASFCLILARLLIDLFLSPYCCLPISGAAVLACCWGGQRTACVVVPFPCPPSSPSAREKPCSCCALMLSKEGPWKGCLTGHACKGAKCPAMSCSYWTLGKMGCLSSLAAAEVCWKGWSYKLSVANCWQRLTTDIIVI